jgi:hypothetical protein
MISEVCVFIVLIAFIFIWLFIQSVEEPFEGVLAKNIPVVPPFNDLRGLTLPTQHAYFRYNDINVFNALSDTGAYIYETNYDPTKINTKRCRRVSCPQSRDNKFCGDVCLACRHVR